MSHTAYILAGVTFYIVSIIILIIVLNIINNNEKKRYRREINALEREKNLIISSAILSEIHKVEALISNNDRMQEKLEDWKERFNEIKDKDVPRITDELIEIEDLFNDKDYSSLDEKIAPVELEIYYVKTKTNFLLDEIKDITLSEEKNRDSIIKLKTEYREIINKYNNNKNDYREVSDSLELQFENVDKLFAAFEVAMENNSYEEVGKIVKGISDIIGNLKIIIGEAPSIILLGKNLIPSKVEDIRNVYNRMVKEGYNLDYLNLEYNIEESNKKISDIFDKLNVLNVEDSTQDLKTILDYFDNLYTNFDEEKNAKKIFDEYTRKIIVRANKIEKVNNSLYRKLDVIKYSYDLSDDDVKVIEVIKQEISAIKKDYDEIINAHRTGSFAYTRLGKEMEALSARLSRTEEKLDGALHNLGGLEEDESRAREQLVEITEIMRKGKDKISSYNLPVIPHKYYVQVEEAEAAVEEMIRELNMQPISIKTLNIRVDTARDLVLKVYNTANQVVKTAAMAEMAVVYGNRYRTVNKGMNEALKESEDFFYKGEYKKSLESTMRALNNIEPGVSEKLLNGLK